MITAASHRRTAIHPAPADAKAAPLQLSCSSLRRHAGAPKKDLFFGAWKHSTTYKHILARVERHEQLLQAPDAPFRRDIARKNIEELGLLCDRYLAGGTRSRNGAIRQLKPLLEHEARALGRAASMESQNTSETRLENVLGLVRPLRFTPDTLRGELRPLGQGACNAVYSARYQIDGKSSEVVIKAVSTQEKGLAAHVTAIPEIFPRTLRRNLLACALDKLLGTHVLVRTEPAIARVSKRAGTEAVEVLCMAMEPAIGGPATKAPASFRNNIGAIQGLVRLQLLDMVCAQGDRHSGNYVVTRGENGMVEVKGYDNDQCFGAGIADPMNLGREMRNARTTLPADWIVGYPPVVDRQTAEMFQALTPEAFMKLMGEHDMTPEETVAAVQRLRRVQEHLQGLQRQGLIVDAGALISPQVIRRFTRYNSYVGRDLLGR